METTARNRTIGGIVIGAILLVLLLILFSCTLASDPGKQSKKAGDAIGAPSATPTLSPDASPTQKPHKKKQGDGTVDTSAVGAVPAVDTGVTFDPPGVIPSGFTQPTGSQKPPSAGIGPCEVNPSLPQCQPPAPPAEPTQPAPPTTPPPTTTSPAPQPPACPSVSVSDVRTRSATVSWSGVSGADAYIVTVDGSDSRQYGPDVLSTRLRHLAPLLPHRVRVQAVDNGVYSQGCGDSVIILQPIGDYDPPADPTGLTCTGASASSATLDWADNTEDDFDSYNVYVAPEGGGEYYQSGITDSQTTVDSLSPDTSYTFSVTALDESGNESGRSGTVTWPDDCDHTPPTTPAGVKITNMTGSAADLTWSASTDDVTVDHYVISAQELDASGAPVGGAKTQETADDSTSASINGLKPETKYSFTVTAVDEVGNESPASTAVTGTTKTKDTTPPKPVTDLHVVGEPTPTSFQVAWTAASDDQTQPSSLVYIVDISGVDDSGSGTVTGKTTYVANYPPFPVLSRTATVTVTVQDQAGNKSTPVSTTVDVPGDSPLSVLTAPRAASAKGAPSTDALASPSQSPTSEGSPSDSPSISPSEVPSLPVILGPRSEPASPRSSTPTPTPTPSPTPTESPSASPSATAESSPNSSGGVVSGVLGAVTGGQ